MRPIGSGPNHERPGVEDAVKANPDAAPILDGSGSGTASWSLPERKVPISLRMDREVVEWFKVHGKRYQSRMNAVLKAYCRPTGKRDDHPMTIGGDVPNVDVLEIGEKVAMDLLFRAPVHSVYQINGHARDSRP